MQCSAVQWFTLRRPNVVLRHGESEGNTNKQLFAAIPDWKQHLTEKGRHQAFETGRKIRKMIGDKRVGFFISPYYRARETCYQVRPGKLHCCLGVLTLATTIVWCMVIRLLASLVPTMWQSLRNPGYASKSGACFRTQRCVCVPWALTGGRPPHRDHLSACTRALNCLLLLLQDTEQIRRERLQVGIYYYRFPRGESGADVYDRITSEHTHACAWGFCQRTPSPSTLHFWLATLHDMTVGPAFPSIP